MTHAEVQKIAKDAMAELKSVIAPGMTLKAVRARCEEAMLRRGADSFWYYDIGAFVFSGDETAVSVSGREYETADRTVQENDIVTVDLSPQCGNVWGDYARTIIIEDGRVVPNAADIRSPEWRRGLLTEERLHRELPAFAHPETTFEELYFHINKLIAELGFVNLDFNGNLGHSIAERREDRIYTERGNAAPLSKVRYFTFEPHIGQPGSQYGFKLENIYYFQDGTLTSL